MILDNLKNDDVDEINIKTELSNFEKIKQALASYLGLFLGKSTQKREIVSHLLDLVQLL